MTQAHTKTAQKKDADHTTRHLRVTEIYKSIQGESTHAGRPCTFIRLARCHLRCVWCDTAYAFYGGDKMTVQGILDRCDDLACPLVEITGGEPLAQKNSIHLAQALLDNGYTVLVETSGTLPIAPLPPDTIKIMDLKCPGSGECEKNDWTNINALTEKDEVKFVIAHREDYEWSRERLRQYDLIHRCHAILFSPVHGSLQPKTLVEWILEDKLDVHFQLQQHKFIWSPHTKGV